MGAVALSPSDEGVLNSLQQLLHLPSKSQVIHRALRELEEAVTRDLLSGEIRKSVLKCGAADRKEHQVLTGAAVNRLDKE